MGRPYPRPAHRLPSMCLAICALVLAGVATLVAAPTGSLSMPSRAITQQAAADATHVAVFGTEPPAKQTAIAAVAAARATASALPTPVYTRAPTLVVHFAAPPASDGPPTDLTDVSFVSTGLGYGVTYSGAVYRSDDGGVTWKELHHLQSTRLYQVQFADAATGFAFGQGGCGKWNCTGAAVLLSTRDGGATWQVVHPDGLSCDPGWPTPSLQIAVVSAAVGFAVVDPDSHGCPGLQGRLLRTADGGRHWRPVPLPSGFTTSGGIDFQDASTGYVTGYRAESECRCSQVIATHDGGRSWAVIYRAPQRRYAGISQPLSVPLYAVQFLSARLGFIAGGFTNGDTDFAPARTLLTTHDGGTTWQTLYQVGAQRWTLPITRLHFTSVTSGWVALGTCPSMGGNQPCEGPLLYTASAGHSWASTGERVLRFSSVGDAAWYVPSPYGPSGGPNVLRRSLDGGATWRTLSQPAAVTVERLQFLDRRTGWIDTDVGVYKTTDGGAHWEPYTFGAPVTDADWPHFLTPTTALALYPGNGPRQLLRTDDGGRTWRQVHLRLPPSGLYDASLATGSANRAWLTFPTFCPSSSCLALLYTSTDAGRTWQQQASNLTAGPVPSVIAFGDARHGAAVGDQLTQLYLTSDGGATWAGHQLPATLDSLSQSVSYVGAGDIWVVGARLLPDFTSEHLLFYSPDGGRHWVVLKNAQLAPTQIDFVSPTIGWLTTGPTGGNLFFTRDGGATWQQLWVRLP